MLGYLPKADLMLRNQETSQRIWIEIEVSRADPSANQVKFGSAHLLDPLPPEDAFVSLVSRDAIPHDTPAFDGRKARQKISSLGFKVAKAADCPAPIQAHFRAWLALHRTTVLADFHEAEILFSPAA